MLIFFSVSSQVQIMPVRRHPLSSWGRSSLSDFQTSWRKLTYCQTNCSRPRLCRWCRAGESNQENGQMSDMKITSRHCQLWPSCFHPEIFQNKMFELVKTTFRSSLRRLPRETLTAVNLFTSSRSVCFANVWTSCIQTPPLTQLNSFQLALCRRKGGGGLSAELYPSFSLHVTWLCFQGCVFSFPLWSRVNTSYKRLNTALF